MKLIVDKGQLPVDWKIKTLDELCEIARGGSPRPIQQFLTNDSDGVNWIKISDASASSKYIYQTKEKIKPDGVKRSRFVNEGDFILSNSMSFGRPYIMRTSGCIHDGWLVLKDKSGLFDQDYFYYFLGSNTTYKQFDNLAAGSTVRNLNIDLVRGVKITLPPLPEQKRIVAILDEVFGGIDRAIANTEKNLTNARELFESYRNSILDQRCREWEATTLGAEIDLMTGFPFKSNQYTESEQSIRLLRGDNIVQGSLRWDDVKKWPESELNEFLTYQLKEGDVVLAMDRPWVKAGLKHAMIYPNDLPCLLVQRTACIRGIKDIESRFLMYLIGSHAFIRHILSNQTGIGVPHISGKQIQSFKFLKPPLSEQNFICNNLDELKLTTQGLESIYRQKLATLNELKQSILQKAFTGELTSDTHNLMKKAAEGSISA